MDAILLIRFFQNFERTTYSKGLKLLVALHSYFTEILICQLLVNDFFTFQWRSLDSLRFDQKSIFFDTIFIFFFFFSSISRDSSICTFHKHSGLIVIQFPLFLDIANGSNNVICHHMTWQATNMVSFCRKSSMICNRKFKGVPSTSPCTTVGVRNSLYVQGLK